MSKAFKLSTSSHMALNRGLGNIFGTSADMHNTIYHDAAKHANNVNSTFSAAAKDWSIPTPDNDPVPFLTREFG